MFEVESLSLRYISFNSFIFLQFIGGSERGRLESRCRDGPH